MPLLPVFNYIIRNTLKKINEQVVIILIRTMRLLRHKHKISYVELSAAAQISTQRLSQIELNPNESTEHHYAIMCCAFEQVIASRKAALCALEEDYRRYRPQLMDYCAREESI